jgi:hypothetical protein
MLFFNDLEIFKGYLKKILAVIEAKMRGEK